MAPLCLNVGAGGVEDPSLFCASVREGTTVLDEAGGRDRPVRTMVAVDGASGFTTMEFRCHWLVNDNNRLSYKYLRWGIYRHTIAASPGRAAEDLEDLDE